MWKVSAVMGTRGAVGGGAVHLARPVVVETVAVDVERPAVALCAVPGNAAVATPVVLQGTSVAQAEGETFVHVYKCIKYL